MAGMDTTPNDLLVLLAVSRTAKFTTAAHNLGLTHTTVSRRIAPWRSHSEGGCSPAPPTAGS
jgi:hypothetical protein